MAKTSITIDTSELKDLLRQINTAAFKALQLVDQAIAATAIDMDRELKETIQKGPTRTGTVYKRGGKMARRSAAGEPPKTDTGRLASSIRHVTSFMQAEVGSLQNVAVYGGYLENPEGLNRPLYKPTHEKYEPIIAKRISIAIQRSGLAS